MVSNGALPCDRPQPAHLNGPGSPSFRSTAVQMDQVDLTQLRTTVCEESEKSGIAVGVDACHRLF
jgi:hypothetical protein